MVWSLFRDETLPKVGVLLCIALLSLVSGLATAWAQDDVETLEDLKDERELAALAAADTAEQIDIDTATVDELAQALMELERFVSLQETRLEDAEQAFESAEKAEQSARRERLRVLADIDVLRNHIADLALSSFTGEGSLLGDDMTELALSEDPGEAARIRHLVQLQTGSLSDNLDTLRSLEVDAELLVAEEEAASEDSAQQLSRVEERTVQVEAARERQALFVRAAEIQLEARLAEATNLAERELELAQLISQQQTAINSRVTQAANAAGATIPTPVDLADIVTIRFPDHRPDYTLEVHVDIAPQAEALFLEAFDDGVDLAGWGYRPIQLQIELRAAHCGGSEHDIWHKSAFECSPPTARPGFSKHEQGRAIDFTADGRSITSQDSAAFRWMAEHAPRYGFVNLESEPWHWSIAEE